MFKNYERIIFYMFRGSMHDSHMGKHVLYTCYQQKKTIFSLILFLFVLYLNTMFF